MKIINKLKIFAVIAAMRREIVAVYVSVAALLAAFAAGCHATTGIGWLDQLFKSWQPILMRLLTWWLLGGLLGAGLLVLVLAHVVGWRNIWPSFQLTRAVHCSLKRDNLTEQDKRWNRYVTGSFAAVTDEEIIVAVRRPQPVTLRDNWNNVLWGVQQDMQAFRKVKGSWQSCGKYDILRDRRTP